MAADLVPIRLSVTEGDLYTLWAPRWRDAGDEWEAFLGKDDDLYAFRSVADLAAFVRSDTDNDLADHPGWKKLTEANAHRFDPAEDRQFDLTSVEEVVAEKPTDASVQQLSRTLGIVSSLGTVCELPPVNKFFNGNPALSTVNAGIDEFSGRAGRKRWSDIAAIVGRSWDGVLTSIEGILTVPDVDATAADHAVAELAEPAPEPDEDEFVTNAAADEYDADDTDSDDEAGHDTAGVLGSDEDFWLKVGIDPIRLMTSTGTLYTLRCYWHDKAMFLGRNGRVSVFSSERAMARYLADEHDHDMADLPTYDDIRTAATDGSLHVEISDENIYVLTGLADDLNDGPEAVDRDQLELVVELLQDIGEYSEEDTVERALSQNQPFGRFSGYVLEDSGSRPAAPYADVVREYEELVRFLESRLRRE
ncbi:MAG TPA: primosomal protein [Mycobacterium sp.]|nr:primosomal protein [Mycobacterium sp.]